MHLSDITHSQVFAVNLLAACFCGTMLKSLVEAATVVLQEAVNRGLTVKITASTACEKCNNKKIWQIVVQCQ